MKKKVTALLMTVGMVVSLVGCGKSEDKKTDAPATEAPATEAPATEAPATEAPATEAPTGEKVDLTMWCIAVESDSNHAAYVSAIDEFKANHPEINFTWEATQNEAYKTKLKAASGANELPDIFFTWGAGFLKDFVDSDRVYCVDDVYAKYKDELPEAMMKNLKFDGHYYGAPTTLNVVTLFGNMDLLKQVGYDTIPATYDELMACCDALVAKGITPFGCSGKEPWCISEYIEPIIAKTCGGETLDAMYAGTTPWNNDQVKQAITEYQNMIKKGYFAASDAALTDNEVKENFKAEKYAFYMNGSWNCADFNAAGMDGKVQVAEWPVVDANHSQMGVLIGGANDSLAVASSSKNKEVAAEACFELAKSICHYGNLNSNGMPAWIPDYDTSSLSQMSNGVASIVSNASITVLYGDNNLSADNQAIYLDYLCQAYSGDVTPEEFVEGLDNDLQY